MGVQIQRRRGGFFMAEQAVYDSPHLGFETSRKRYLRGSGVTLRHFSATHPAIRFGPSVAPPCIVRII